MKGTYSQIMLLDSGLKLEVLALLIVEDIQHIKTFSQNYPCYSASSFDIHSVEAEL